MRNLTHETIGATATLAVCAAVDSGAAVATNLVLRLAAGITPADADQLNARIHRRTRLEQRRLGDALAGGVLRLPMTTFAALANLSGSHALAAQRSSDDDRP